MHGMSKDILNQMFLFPKGSKIFFDDALVSVYLYIDELKKLKRLKNFTYILPFNPGIVQRADEENKPRILNYIQCSEAHKLAKENNNFRHFMTTKIIDELITDLQMIPALHSWDHFLFEKDLIVDISQTINFIENNQSWFNRRHVYFIWPYNKEIPDYKILFDLKLKELNKKALYFGNDRIDGPWNSYFKEDKR